VKFDFVKALRQELLGCGELLEIWRAIGDLESYWRFEELLEIWRAVGDLESYWGFGELL